MTSLPHDACPAERSAFDAYFVAAVACLAVTLVWVATQAGGVGATPDTVRYFEVAQEMARGHGVQDRAGAAFVVQPPLYPALLAPAFALGADGLRAAAVVHGLLLAATVLIIAQLLAAVQSTLLRRVALLPFTLPAITQVYVLGWSEPTFILWCTLFLTFAQQLPRGAWKSVLWMACAAALACLTRYAGFFLIPCGVVLLLRNGRTKATLQQSAAFVAIAATPVGLWMLRNQWLTGSMTGARPSTALTFEGTLRAAGTVLLDWLVPALPPLPSFALAVPALVVLTCLAIHLRGPVAMRTPSLMVALYVVFIIYACCTTAMDGMNRRLLSPAFVPFTLLVVLALDRLARRRWGPWLAAPIMVSCLTANAYAAQREALRGGRGFVDRIWQRSEVLQFAQERRGKDRCAVYSNAPWALTIRNLGAAILPAKRAYNSSDKERSAAALRGKWPAEPVACVAWFEFYRKQSKNLFTIEDIRAVTKVVREDKFRDGVYLVVEPLRGDAARETP